MRLELSEAGKVVFTNAISCSAMPQPSLSIPTSVRLGLYDPRGTTASLLQRFGLSFSTVTNLRTAAYEQLDLLVVGRNALTNEPLAEVGNATVDARWQEFALRGGWVLILEQTNYPAYMPGELRISDFDASFAFPNPDHPATQDLTTEDLRWWAGDHRLVSKALRLPTRSNFRALATIGSRSGLEYAAAVETPIGAGGILCSQWLLTERFDTEPFAGELLQRIFNYCSSSAGHMSARPVALLTETDSLAATKLTQLGLLAENLSGRLTNCEPAIYPVLIVAGANAAWQEAREQLSVLANYVDRGGKLVLHRPDAAFLSAARSVLFPGVDYDNATLGLVLRRDSPNAAVRLASHDLYWIEQPGDWNRPELLSTNVARRIYRKHFNLSTANIIQVENMPIHTIGATASGGWWLWGNGYVAQDIQISEAGTYLFNVLAKGTPAAGGWPQMTLKIDGRAQDLITVTSGQQAYYTLSADLSPGTHQLALVFDNDAYAPPEDRNLFLDHILWGRDADNSSVLMLTRPGAVAQVRRGKGLIVLDEIAWETEIKNATKAGRFASTLLTGLGAAMRLPPALHLEAESMRNVNVAAYQVNGGLAWLNSGGRIETSVRFTSTGTYTFDLVAGGTLAQGVLPKVGLTVDGVTRTNFFLTSTNMGHYTFSLAVAVGTHTIGLIFLNDVYAPPDDRNAAFDYLRIAPPAALRISGLYPDLERQTMAVQWESNAGKAYDVQISSSLEAPAWQTVKTITTSGSITTWEDADN
ncbi:MAG TPA: carbohydrate-binding domain-containing protein, partial [Clostridia bacterium]|nr:carbohydrate-binding domain-containing protein [Clostridia bacterium]